MYEIILVGYVVPLLLSLLMVIRKRLKREIGYTMTFVFVTIAFVPGTNWLELLALLLIGKENWDV